MCTIFVASLLPGPTLSDMASHSKVLLLLVLLIGSLVSGQTRVKKGLQTGRCLGFAGLPMRCCYPKLVPRWEAARQCSCHRDQCMASYSARKRSVEELGFDIEEKDQLYLWIRYCQCCKWQCQQVANDKSKTHILGVESSKQIGLVAHFGFADCYQAEAWFQQQPLFDPKDWESYHKNLKLPPCPCYHRFIEGQTSRCDKYEFPYL